MRDIGSMGRRKLAYVIGDHSEGLYILSHFLHPPEGIVPMRESLKLKPAVIRTLIVRYKDRPEIELGKEELEETAVEAGEPEIAVLPSAETVIKTSASADERIGYIGEEEYPGPDPLKQDINIDPSPGEDSAEGGIKEV